jgi:zinc protease
MLDDLAVARWAVLAAALACVVPAVAAAGATERTLANGLKVVVKEDHRSPVLVSMVWYRAGSMDEVSGTTGVAHVLEHMMFKGTQKVPRGEFSRIIARAGGRDNAFTSRDHTVYHQQLHKSKLALALELEADRMVNLQFSAEEFAKEMKVIMEERRMRTDDDPHAQLSELMMATVYAVHPYRTPVIGWMNDLANMRLADAREWYEKWYAPNNATLVVGGDVDAEEVFRLAEKFFGPIPARTLPQRKQQVEPPQRGVKRVSLKAPADQPYLLMAYNVPVLRDVDNDWEPYALSVLGGVLDGSPAARLPRELVKNSRIANSAGSGYDITNRGPGLFYLDGVPAEGRSAAEVEMALRDQIRRLVEEGISEDELRRVKAQVIAARVFAQDSVFYQAMRIGVLHTVGLPHDSADRQVKKLQDVSAAQVREVARKYLVDDNLTVAVLDPQRLATGARPRPKAGNGRDE